MLTKKIISGLLLALCMLLPQLGRAAQLIFNAAALEVGTQHETVVDVSINPQQKKINAVEGIIQFSGPAADGLRVSVENGQSVLPIWPTPPHYDEVTKSIAFVGGVPQGFDSSGLLFRLRLTPSLSGALTIAYVSGSAYLNDGRGTKAFVDSQSLELKVVERELELSDTSLSSSDSVLGGIILVLLAGIVCAVIIYGYKKTRAH